MSTLGTGTGTEPAKRMCVRQRSQQDVPRSAEWEGGWAKRNTPGPQGG